MTSSEPDGQFERFRTLLQSTDLFKARPIAVERAGPPVDFDEYNAVQLAIRAALDKLRRRHIANDEISLDVTSGTKPFSIAAAAKSFEPGFRFLYVSNKGLPQSYDATIRLAGGLIVL